jgi:peptidoglycan/xylan/chitin deacetylase (PgdA/CDA1 family)
MNHRMVHLYCHKIRWEVSELGIHMKKLVLFVFLITIFLCKACPASGNEYQQNYVPILMYHQFDEDPSNSSSTTVTPETFKEQMSYLKEAGYETITTEDLFLFLTRGSALPPKPLLITIDDGYLSNYTYAYPILKELNMKATIFAIVSYRENTDNLLYPHFNWEQAKEMVDSGIIDIQSHSYACHFQFMDRGGCFVPGTKQLNDENYSQYEERIYKDFLMARVLLEEKLGNKVISMAFPYGYHDGAVKKAATESGYDLLFTIREDVVYPGDNPLQLPRINVPGHFTGADIEARIRKLSKQREPASVYFRINGEMASEEPMLSEGVSYLPLSSFSPMPRLTITVGDEKDKVSVSNRKHTLEILKDEASVFLDGKEIDFPCFVFQDVLYVSVRSFSEAMGYKVDWIPKWFGDFSLIDVKK